MQDTVKKQTLAAWLPAAVLGLALACAPSMPSLPNPNPPPTPPTPSAPAIIAEPTNRGASAGLTATFSVTAMGYPLYYQWDRAGMPIPGATSSQYSLVTTLADNGASFTVTVSNSLGTVTSSAATLTVLPPPQVSVLAGTPWSSGTIPAFNLVAPKGICWGNNGYLVVAEAGGDAIQRITPPGLTTLLAGGEGLAGETDGPWPLARFSDPTGVVQDGSGNTYVADTANHTLRVISAQGMTRVLAGTRGIPGSADGRGSAAGFNGPTGLAFDIHGNLLVADTGNNLIRAVDLEGNVSTVAGSRGAPGYNDGAQTSAVFNAPTGVAAYDDYSYDQNGDQIDDEAIYVCDTGNDALRVIQDGNVGTLAGGVLHGQLKDGPGSAAGFNGPSGLSLDTSGDAWVADTGNNAIRFITSSGTVTTLAGATGKNGSLDGPGATATFSQPQGLTQLGDGTVYVADTGNGLIRAITPAGVVSTLPLGAPVTGSGDGVGSLAAFNLPSGLALDGAGNVIVADCLNHTIRALAPSGQVTTLAGSPGVAGSQDGAQATFNGPSGVAVDASGNIYVADWLNSTIRVIAPSGSVSTLAGQAGTTGSADGTGAQARFNYPHGLALDGLGNLYVADTGNALVRKVVIATGAVATATLVNTYYPPTAVAVGPTGTLYVGNGNQITVYSGAGAWTQIPATCIPVAMAVDGSGDLYVADSLNPVVWQTGPLFGFTSFEPFLGDLVSASFTGGSYVPESASGGAGSIPYANGLVLDPVTGNLYVSTANGILKVVP